MSQTGDTTDTRPDPDPRHSLEKEIEILRKQIMVPCEANLHLPTVVLADIQFLGNKWDKLKARAGIS